MSHSATLVMDYPLLRKMCRRWLAGLLAVLMGFGPLLTPAYAAGLIPLANEPIGIQNNAPPNIVLTIDDSSSMLSDWLPEAVAADDYTPNLHCRGALGAMGSACGSIGSANDYSSFAGATNKYFSPGWTAQQYNYPYSKYTGNYDASGPGAGCVPGSPPTCYHGVDPVNLPGGLTQANGIGNFPIADPNDATSPPVGWPLAGTAYPYWQLWPAPVHNAAVNTLYYNPEQTYAPPVDSTGASYPQMNAANTSTWTQVPGDPWASSIVYVDLTAAVTVGLWCDSDWSLGAQNDPTQCRRNGTAAALVGTGHAADGQDYTYPWAPPGFTASPSTGDSFASNGSNPYARVPSTLLSYAAQKVGLDPITHNAIQVAGNGNLYTTALWFGNVSGANTTSQDAKFFYENENILWCDPTNAAWPAQNTRETCQNVTTQSPCNGVQPQVCNLQTQTCSAQSQTCVGEQTQVCNLGAQTCNGVQTQVCNGAQTQVCNGAQTQVCNNAQTQTCVNAQTQTCLNVTAGVCNGAQAQTCTGAITQTCNAQTQTCNGVQVQTCNAQTQVCNLQAQTCNGVQTQTCGLQAQTCVGSTQVCNLASQTCSGPFNQVCNLPGTQTCQPPVCTTTYTPPGCNLLPPDPENPCTGSTSCAPPVCTPNPGTCSLQTSVSCTSNANCPALPGTCSSSGTSCMSNSACPQIGTCSISGASCTSNANCPLSGGHCSIQTGTACQANTDCGQAGHCSVQTGTVCTSNGNCPNIAGNCSIQTGTSCQVNTDCVQAGHCSVQTGTVCTANANCAIVPGVCSIQTGTACTTAANCPNVAGHCSIQTATACTTAANCPVVAGVCNVQTTTACTTAANCPIVAGHCSVVTGTACTTNANCATVPGLCNNGTTACTANGNCPAFGGHCSVQTGTACTTNAGCVTVPGHCSVVVATACTTNANCATVPGTCSVQTATSCTSNANCPTVSGHCSVQTGTTCTTNANCPTVSGHCSVQTGTTCTTNANCPNVSGHCSIQTGTTCLLNTDCAQAGFCSVQTGTVCTSNGNCPTIAGHCSIQTGTSCTSDPNCATIPGVCSVQTGTTCTTAGNCPAAGYCSVQTGTICTSNGNCPTVAGVCAVGGATCTSNSTCPLTGTCSIHNNVVCQTNNDCPFFALPASAVTCSTGGVGGVATADLRQDAENNGIVCRRNNKAYAAVGSVPAVAAGRYNYPNNYGTAGNNYTTPITGGSGADACTSTPHFVSVPRHYWNTSVEWCDAQVGLAGDKWLGYGNDPSGTGADCQAGYDSTHLYPRFYQFGATSYVDNYANAAFQRVDLDITQRATATYTTTWTDASGQQQTVTRSFDQEMTNYANWFAYYRTRVQAVKTVTSLVFNQLDDTYNVGFHTLSNGLTTATAQSDPATFVNVAAFNAGQKAAWFQQLFAISIPLRLETPTLDAMVRIGQYFLNGTSPNLPGSTDPITLSCQKNWHMLFTDGFVNQPTVPATVVGDQDLTVPTYPDFAINPIPGMVPGQAWPHPYQEDPNATAANSQSDYAMYYWVTDLRTGAGPTAPNNVPTSSTDPADWQHLNFAALSLGTQGQLPGANPSLTMNQLAAGSRQWPQPYPTVNHPNNSGVDDLWHAAVNGRGQFVNANSAAQLELGMGQILQNITNQAGSRAAAGFQSNSISAGNNSIYEVSFQPGWGGDVVKVPVDPVTGLPGAPVWDAAAQLGTQLLIAAPGDTPWYTNRKIFTINDANQAVPMVWTNLSAAQQDSLAPGLPATGQSVLAFLRGSPTNEGISLGQFRVRATVASGEDFLGDIVDSSAIYVGPPGASYLDGNDPGYSNFVTNHSARTPMVYFGANDGMLHAVNDTTGSEAWAFMPHDLFRAAATGLGALSYQNGALPPFRHHYYVDSTPRVIDVDFGNQNWHSLLVGGLGKGGKSYYALDVTNPAAVTSELTAASQYLWTFTDADMGYTYMQPIVAKTRAFNGAWLVIATSGYNNPSGVGKVYFINAADGTLLQTMSTGFGNAANPSGFAQIAGYTKDFHNQLVEQLYGGDLYGNLWRFDVSDPNPSNWTVVQMASLTDPTGIPQPVTTPPNIEVDAVNGIDRWVFVGTGRLLDPTDLTTPAIANQIQTLYAFRDGTGITPSTIATTLQPRVSLVPLIDKINGVANKPQFGWYDDLPAGQRIITPPQAAISLVAYAGTSPQTDPCLTGQPATLYVRDFSYGTSLLADAGGNPVAGVAEASGAVGMDVFSFPGSSTSAASGTLDIRIGVTAGTTGAVTFFKVNVNFPFEATRMSWRLLGQ